MRAHGSALMRNDKLPLPFTRLIFSPYRSRRCSSHPLVSVAKKRTAPGPPFSPPHSPGDASAQSGQPDADQPHPSLPADCWSYGKLPWPRSSVNWHPRLSLFYTRPDGGGGCPDRGYHVSPASGEASGGCPKTRRRAGLPQQPIGPFQSQVGNARTARRTKSLWIWNNIWERFRVIHLPALTISRGPFWDKTQQLSKILPFQKPQQYQYSMQ